MWLPVLIFLGIAVVGVGSLLWWLSTLKSEKDVLEAKRIQAAGGKEGQEKKGLKISYTGIPSYVRDFFILLVVTYLIVGGFSRTVLLDWMGRWLLFSTVTIGALAVVWIFRISGMKPFLLLLSVVLLMNHTAETWSKAAHRKAEARKTLEAERLAQTELDIKTDALSGPFSLSIPAKDSGQWSETFKIPKGSYWTIASQYGMRVRSVTKGGKTISLPPEVRSFAYASQCRFPEVGDSDFYGWPSESLGDSAKEDLFLQAQSATAEAQELRGCVKARSDVDRYARRVW